MLRCPVCSNRFIALVFGEGKATAEAKCFACGAEWFQLREEQLVIRAHVAKSEDLGRWTSGRVD